jgi:excinuclease ABC subunit B
MQNAIDETNRRRKIQEDFNIKHEITPETIIKAVKKIDLIGKKPTTKIGRWYSYDVEDKADLESLPVAKRIEYLTKQMQRAVKELQFEHALYLREEIQKIKKADY